LPTSIEPGDTSKGVGVDSEDRVKEDMMDDDSHLSSSPIEIVSTAELGADDMQS
ncbi:hypothetical protein CCACVL1_02258, partial [Corchorus capsularis]